MSINEIIRTVQTNHLIFNSEIKAFQEIEEDIKIEVSKMNSLFDQDVLKDYKLSVYTYQPCQVPINSSVFDYYVRFVKNEHAAKCTNLATLNSFFEKRELDDVEKLIGVFSDDLLDLKNIIDLSCYESIGTENKKKISKFKNYLERNKQSFSFFKKDLKSDDTYFREKIHFTYLIDIVTSYTKNEIQFSMSMLLNQIDFINTEKRKLEENIFYQKSFLLPLINEGMMMHYASKNNLTHILCPLGQSAIHFANSVFYYFIIDYIFKRNIHKNALYAIGSSFLFYSIIK